MHLSSGHDITSCVYRLQGLCNHTSKDEWKHQTYFAKSILTILHSGICIQRVVGSKWLQCNLQCGSTGRHYKVT